MKNFASSELSVKLIDNSVVVVEARHDERQHGLVSRHFIHRYRLPHNVDPTTVTSDLSDDGMLTITAMKVIFMLNQLQLFTFPPFFWVSYRFVK